METTDKCIILKKKEYEDLLLKAGEKSYYKIDILFSLLHPKGEWTSSTTIDLSDKLKSQITNIFHHVRSEFLQYYKEEVKDVKEYLTEKYSKDLEDAYRELAKMSCWKRYKFLKQYRNEK
jgi:hypothetical protein